MKSCSDYAEKKKQYYAVEPTLSLMKKASDINIWLQAVPPLDVDVLELGLEEAGKRVHLVLYRVGRLDGEVGSHERLK